MKTLRHKLFVALKVLFFVLGGPGTLMHVNMAMAWTPVLWPVSWIMDVTALWQGGWIEARFTWALSILYELTPFAIGLVLYLGATRRLEAKRRPRAAEPTGGWEPLV